MFAPRLESAPNCPRLFSASLSVCLIALLFLQLLIIARVSLFLLMELLLTQLQYACHVYLYAPAITGYLFELLGGFSLELLDLLDGLGVPPSERILFFFAKVCELLLCFLGSYVYLH